MTLSVIDGKINQRTMLTFTLFYDSFQDTYIFFLSESSDEVMI